MKKILLVIGIFISILFVGEVNALTFKEGDFIQYEYVKKIIDGKPTYMTIQFIRDENNNYVYCLEPYVKFSDGTSYKEYSSDFSDYTKLSEEQLRRIELLAYYGYGHPERMGNKWYAITQYLIWKTVDPSDNIYFTDTLNGNRINKYEKEISEIEADVSKNKINMSFAPKTYNVDLNSDLVMFDENDVLDQYKIVSSDYSYYMKTNTITIKNIVKEGKMVFRKKHEIYDDTAKIYISDNSQDLYKPGNPVEEELEVNIKLKKGNILLNVYDDDSVYSIEKDFSNTCYGLYNEEDNMIDKLCTNKEISYKTNDLAYGKFYVKQISNGIGYKKDENIYNIVIDENHEQVVVDLKNKLIRNTIVIDKVYCKETDCLLESGATFEVYDKDNNLIKNIVTNEKGYTEIELGYGSYYFKQVSGIEGYKLAEVFEDRIEDETTTHIHNLRNEWINIEEVKSIVEEESSEEILPPDTGVKGFYGRIIECLNYFVKSLKSVINCLKIW